MADHSAIINLLKKKLDDLSSKQDVFKKEIDDLRNQIQSLALLDLKETEVLPVDDKVTEEVPIQIPVQENLNEKKAIQQNVKQPQITIKKSAGVKSDLEKFIGENLINKIGIIVLIIGVGIGAKYAIDNKLISPLTRIILGYLIGISLFGFAVKLKQQYENFSSVLLSGSMAIMYFITFFAYNFYDLIPQMLAFILMVVFTAFTVLASINYNKQIIAHIGLVGAYCVPILLSDNSGRVGILFSYMVIINIGILALGFVRYWKSLHYSSFILTWLIYIYWVFIDYQPVKHFSLALIFITAFFMIFYISFLAYKILKSEKFLINDIILLLINSFLFYGISYGILSDHLIGKQLLGLFTLANALIHFAVSIIVYKRKLADRNIFYFISGLVLVFISIAIPVQLDGNWVTMLWAVQAAILFWIGRSNHVPVYENISYPLMALAFFSIIQDWSMQYSVFYLQYSDVRTLTLFNINFLSSLIFISAFAFIVYLRRTIPVSSIVKKNKDIGTILSFLIPGILLTAIFVSMLIEIEVYWNQLMLDTRITIKAKSEYDYSRYIYNYDFAYLKTISKIIYSMLFLSALSFVNINRLRNKTLAITNLIANAIMLIIFLTAGLLAISELRHNYLNDVSEYFQSGLINIIARYISFLALAVFLFATYKLITQDFVNKKLLIPFELALHTAIVWILSSEWIHWMDIFSSTESYKISLSIIWGVYSLSLIALGIWKKKKHLRITAIVLFTITLIKLFVYDASNLDTIPKTILFVSLGILLLISSFLYNRFKNIIFNEDGNSK